MINRVSFGISTDPTRKLTNELINSPGAYSNQAASGEKPQASSAVYGEDKPKKSKKGLLGLLTFGGIITAFLVAVKKGKLKVSQADDLKLPRKALNKMVEVAEGINGFLADKFQSVKKIFAKADKEAT